MSEEKTEVVSWVDTRNGDKVIATFEFADITQIIKGTVKDFQWGKEIKGWGSFNTANKIERVVPDWKNALVVKAGSCLYGRANTTGYDKWFRLGSKTGISYTDHGVENNGPVQIIIDKDWKVVA